MPYEKPLAQTVIVAVVIFCTVFSFLPLFLTLVNSLKTEMQVKVNAFSLPEVVTFITAGKSNFNVAWQAIGNYYFSTILVSLIGAVCKVLISATLAYILTFKNFYFFK